MRMTYLAVALLFVNVSHAADDKRTLAVNAPTLEQSKQELRLALVIGNAAYKEAPLVNPINDARALASSLREVGFNVIQKENLTQAEMKRVVRDFSGKLQKSGGVGLFYFAGHGVQVKGRNYLIPIGADIQREYEIQDQAVDVNLILDAFEYAKNRMNIMILDACRNNPFTRSSRSMADGLTRMEAPSGALIAFATAPGRVASDGDSGNGLYTKHLVTNIRTPGLTIEQVFKRVREGVEHETHGYQSPREESSLKGEDFYFARPVEQREDTAMLIRAAERGDTKAQIYLGNNYFYGNGGVKADVSEAITWYRKAAELNDSTGQYKLAWAYYTGQGVNKDYAQALNWVLKAADQGHTEAQFYAGEIYTSKDFGVLNYAEAARWYRKAAEAGHAKSQAHLSVLYFQGWGVEKDYKGGASWADKSANQGDSTGQLMLAAYYMRGAGVEKDIRKAEELLSTSASQGNGKARELLEMMRKNSPALASSKDQSSDEEQGDVKNQTDSNFLETSVKGFFNSVRNILTSGATAESSRECPDGKGC